MRRWLIAMVVAASPAALAQPVTNAVPDTNHPGVVALVAPQDELVCTAALIAPHTVLTAAHCVDGNPLLLRAFFGSVIAEGGTFIAINDAHPHPQFNPGGNDIALVTLAVAAPTEPLAFAAPLDTSVVDSQFSVVGFGIVGDIGGDGTKREGFAKIAALGDADFVAVPDVSLSCFGDSGGPALRADSTIFGVVSRVDSKCVDHAVYTRTDVYRDSFIQPYLDATAPGAAAEGEPCFYEGHCAAGLECRGKPTRTCEPIDSGCGCQSSDPRAGVLGLMLFALATRRRSSRRTL